MDNLSRRDFIRAAAAATLVASATPSFALPRTHRVFIGSDTPQGILAYNWNADTGELTADGVAAKLENAVWITLSPDRKYLFAASEVDNFNDKPSGGVASYSVVNGALELVSTRNSTGAGTCHLSLDRTGQVLIAVDYADGSAAGFPVTDGWIGLQTWNEHYMGHGPNTARQESAHAHFVSFSPDNRFVYINDLGSDCIHIYRLNAKTAALSAAGSYKSKPGAGPRTLHFHPNGHTAYSINELNSTVDVLDWSAADGGLALRTRIELLPSGYTGDTHACDTVISKEGKYVYFANRGNNSIYLFYADAETGGLTAGGRFDCGGKTPRNFVLDPTERWMLVANQDSNQLSVFARNPETGALAEKATSFAAEKPMCILFA